MLQIESPLKRRGGFLEEEAGQNPELTSSGEAVLGGKGGDRSPLAWLQLQMVREGVG